MGGSIISLLIVLDVYGVEPGGVRKVRVYLPFLEGNADFSIARAYHFAYDGRIGSSFL
jgi:hypothetical protein